MYIEIFTVYGVSPFGLMRDSTMKEKTKFGYFNLRIPAEALLLVRQICKDENRYICPFIAELIVKAAKERGYI